MAHEGRPKARRVRAPRHAFKHDDELLLAGRPAINLGKSRQWELVQAAQIVPAGRRVPGQALSDVVYDRRLLPIEQAEAKEQATAIEPRRVFMPHGRASFERGTIVWRPFPIERDLLLAPPPEPNRWSQPYVPFGAVSDCRLELDLGRPRLGVTLALTSELRQGGEGAVLVTGRAGPRTPWATLAETPLEPTRTRNVSGLRGFVWTATQDLPRFVRVALPVRNRYETQLRLSEWAVPPPAFAVVRTLPAGRRTGTLPEMREWRNGPRKFRNKEWPKVFHQTLAQALEDGC